MKSAEDIVRERFGTEKETFGRAVVLDMIRQAREEVREECAKTIQERADAYRGVHEITVHEAEQCLAAIRALDLK